ncbi:PIN domain nuclease [Candidatus Electronema halotolerans]
MTVADEQSGICFVDSNIWLYAFIETQDARKANIATALIQNQSIAVSTQIINEVCSNLIRKVKFSEGEARELIQSFYDRYEVVGIDKEILIKSSELRENHNFSFWDSLVVVCAVQSGADILYSEDMQDGFVLERTKIVNPFA